MRIGLRHADGHVTLDVQRDGSTYRIQDGSADRMIRAELVGADGLVLEIDGTRHHVTFCRRDDTFLVAVAGETYVLTREQSAAAGHYVATVASPDIVAPMPGKVIQVLVKPGDAVANGDALLILEAMKMENRLLAEAPGVVEAVRVRAGELVDGGQVLAVLKYDQSDDAG